MPRAEAPAAHTLRPFHLQLSWLAGAACTPPCLFAAKSQVPPVSFLRAWTPIMGSLGLSPSFGLPLFFFFFSYLASLSAHFSLLAPCPPVFPSLGFLPFHPVALLRNSLGACCSPVPFCPPCLQSTPQGVLVGSEHVAWDSGLSTGPTAHLINKRGLAFTSLDFCSLPRQPMRVRGVYLQGC